jgi:hypothetical protein
MAEPIGELTPYSTARSLMGTLPTWMDDLDAQRIMAYQVYEQIYKNVPETFMLTQRGTDQSPIYIPNGRIIVDTTDRYTATGFGYTTDPAFGSTAEQQTALLAFKALFDRERFLSKFAANKKFGLIRGDWFFHIVADPNRLPGKRISIYTVDPAAVFYVPHPDDLERNMGVHIIEMFEESGEQMIKRQTYSKGPDPYDPETDDGKIWSSLTIHSMDDWQDPAKSPVRTIIEPYPLDPLITAFPVYHIKNSEEPGNPWGVSELMGLERVMGAVNQAISDEELALALEGLGMYATNSGPPTDEEGNETNWILGPGRVVEVAGADEKSTWFKRVGGIGSVVPYQDHLKFLTQALREGSGTPNIAIGQVEVTVAESGVALALQMAPMLGKAEVKDINIRDVSIQMFYDLKAWLQVYEAINTGLALVVPQFGPKLPVNVEQEVDRILKMVEAKIMSLETARVKLTALGYQFAANEGDLVVEEAASVAVASDPFAVRATGETGAPTQEITTA